MHAHQAAEADNREMMRQEAVLGLRHAAGHPNLARVLDYFDDAQGPQVRRCIVMELVNGASVAELRGPDRRLPAPIVRRIAWDVLEALSYLHGQGVLHRDLSPHNILVTADGVVKVADFGLAREMEQGKVQTMRVCGTPVYVCPEAIQMLGCDARADLFTLAAVLYELLSGLPPTGTLERGFSIVARILQGQVPPLPAGTPTDLDELIIGTLQLDPGARWPQTTAQALDLLRGHEQPIASPEELAALVAPAQARRQAELADARPTGVLPEGHVLVPCDYVAKPLRGRALGQRIINGHVVTRRALAVAGIVAGLAAGAAGLGLVLHGQPREQPGAMESPQPREAPAPLVAPVEPMPAPPVPPDEPTPAEPTPPRVAAPAGKRIESQRGARRTGPTRLLRKQQPLGDEPPSWGAP